MVKGNTIKWRIFKYYILFILILIPLVAISFNIAIRLYLEKDIMAQLTKIADRAEDVALRQGPSFFPGPQRKPPHPGAPPGAPPDDPHGEDSFRFYLMLDRSLRETLSVLNADYILLDRDQNRIAPSRDDIYMPSPPELLEEISVQVRKGGFFHKESSLTLNLSGVQYLAIVKPLSEKDTFGLGCLVIFSSLEKVNQLQWVINIILLCILLFSAVIIIVISSVVSKKISAPFSSMNSHIRSLAERNFATKIDLRVDDELQELVNNINTMSEKLESYDLAQKTFLQNASHEFRTPLMSIQSYAEGIKHQVLDSHAAIEIIIDEARRMASLVDDLLYLSRLDAIEENYHFSDLDFVELLGSCMERMHALAQKNAVTITLDSAPQEVLLHGDGEKLSRAVINLVGNCIRYAKSKIHVCITVQPDGSLCMTISDDGPGFVHSDLPHLFDRFFKGKNGNFGLGLAICKSVIEKHGGSISAANLPTGAAFTVYLPVSTH